MKRKLIIGSILVILLATLTTGTWAYYSSKTVAHNVITSGNVKIDLLEWADKDKTKPFVDLTGIMPGTSVTKVPEVKNVGEGEAWIRAKVEISIVNADKEQLPNEKNNKQLVTFKLLNNGWIDGKDGYYYYEKFVKPDGLTEPIFDTVSFDAAMDNPYQNCKATVTIKAEAVQTANNPIPAGGSVTDIKGWPDSTKP